ncbi:hypothetical protein RP20_CCG023721 [Aedes albopictus]|nr:hypothetical protein RP20_CCG023721 [Aedes albopictus]
MYMCAEYGTELAGEARSGRHSCNNISSHSCPVRFSRTSVCIVQKRDNGNLFAMKYVSRSACIGRGALGGVLKEVELLATLEHPFLVNLWFSFQEDLLNMIDYQSLPLQP